MSLWIFATFFAASVQAFRFLLQKRLALGGLSPVAATFARFVWAPPVLFLGLALWAATGHPIPAPPPGFWLPAVAGAISQILATICVVALFAHRNFAVGIAFSKTTVLMTVLTGFLILGETVTWFALAAMVVGFAGVVLLSVPLGGTGWQVFNRASGLGLAAGAFFSVSAVGYRAASLGVPSDEPLLRAAITLGWVTLIQTGILAAWLGWRDRAGLVAVFTEWRATTLVGATSLAGSLAWFTAYTLQTAALVNAVGQVELILSMLISWLILGERTTRRELMGIALLGASVVGLVILTA
ncbi:MAG: DMT family transporter [Pseudomonadota bacterium]